MAVERITGPEADAARARAVTAAAVSAVQAAMAAAEVASIIGRERALVDGVAEVLHRAASTRHDHTPVRETRRGASFDLDLRDPDGEPADRIARVTVELVPPAQRARHDALAAAALAAAVDRYAAASGGVIPAGVEPGDLGHLFDAVAVLDRSAIATALADLTAEDVAADDLGPVVRAARAYVEGS